jgi:hypothetical protein
MCSDSPLYIPFSIDLLTQPHLRNTASCYKPDLLPLSELSWMSVCMPVGIIRATETVKAVNDLLAKVHDRKLHAPISKQVCLPLSQYLAHGYCDCDTWVRMAYWLHALALPHIWLKVAQEVITRDSANQCLSWGRIETLPDF